MTNLRLIPLCIIVLLLANTLLADSWMAPHESDIKSANGRFNAHITPGKKGEKASTVSVSKVGDSSIVWTTVLVNPVSPVEVLLADDGEHVVTMDEWARAGYGDNVLVFYNRRGVIRKYSLEQILQVEKIDLEMGVPTSVSSRWWREASIEFIDSPAAGGPEYCVMWLGWAKRWLAWDVATGVPKKVEGELQNRWEQIARKRAIAMVKEGEAVHTGIRFLGALRNPEDRKLIESQLSAGSFSGGHGSTSGDGPKISRVTEISGESWLRQTADRTLAAWDNPAIDVEARDAPYVYLGEVRGTLKLPQPPPSNSNIYMLLIPANTPPNQWAEAQPIHRLHIRFYAYSFSRLVADKDIPFSIRGVTPGRYWVKAIFDVAAPLQTNSDFYRGEAGDYESTQGPTFDVRAGEVAKVDDVHCMTKILPSK